MPDDLPLPVGEVNGVFVPSTAKETDLVGYDPWTWAQPMKEKDHALPENDSYGEPSKSGKSGSIVAEWGGMPSPVRDYQDRYASTLALKRQLYNNQGPAGVYYGSQQTAWEASYVPVATDYWSTLILGSA